MKRQSHSSRRRPMSETSCGIKGTRRCWRILAGCMLVTLVAACGSTIPAPIPSPTTVSTPAQVGGPRTGPTNGTVTMTPIAEYDLDLSSGSYSVERNDGMVRALPDGLLFEPNAIALVMPGRLQSGFQQLYERRLGARRMVLQYGQLYLGVGSPHDWSRSLH